MPCALTFTVVLTKRKQSHERDIGTLLYANLQSTCFFLGPATSWLDALHTIFFVAEPVTSFLKAVALSATFPDIAPSPYSCRCRWQSSASVHRNDEARRRSEGANSR